MARPIKTFTETEAADYLVRIFNISQGETNYDLAKSLKAGPDQYGAALDLAKAEILALYSLRRVNAASLPADLRAWIDKHLSAEGWTRIQAARRQSIKHKSSRDKSNRDMITKISSDTNFDFVFLAEECGVTKKLYIERLANWLQHTENGKKAAQSFARTLQAS